MAKTQKEEIEINLTPLRYRFKDGHTGTVRWERDSAVGWGVMTTDNGQQFTVSRDEVEKL